MKKAFTLIELIVVITILAILSTIAFISLQGYKKESNYQKNNQESYKRIKYDWWLYYTKNYRKTDDGCISFIDKYNDKYNICWTYLIKE